MDVAYCIYPLNTRCSVYLQRGAPAGTEGRGGVRGMEGRR